MKIDNRILLPFALPFVLLALFRAFEWVAGANWPNNITAVGALFLGMGFGAAVMVILFGEGITIGHTHLRRPGRSDE